MDKYIKLSKRLRSQIEKNYCIEPKESYNNFNFRAQAKIFEPNIFPADRHGFVTGWYQHYNDRAYIFCRDSNDVRYCREIYKETLLRGTGLIDSNGKEIFQGDELIPAIEIYAIDGLVTGNFTCVWENFSFRFRNRDYQYIKPEDYYLLESFTIKE